MPTLRNNPMAALRWLAIALALTLTLGCSSKPTQLVPETDLVKDSHQAADALMDKMQESLEFDKPLLAASFVHIDDLQNSSAFGRIIAEQVASRFIEQGYSVIEMKLRRSVFIKERAGEFMLSRQVKAISQNHDAQAVIVGTYAVAQDSVYVSARIVRATDSRIISAHDYKLPLTPDVRALIRSQQRRR